MIDCLLTEQAEAAKKEPMQEAWRDITFSFAEHKYDYDHTIIAVLQHITK